MRKFITMLVILTYLAIYIGVAATLGGMLAKTPVWIQIPYFALAGTLWAIPLRPIMKWMHKSPRENAETSDR